VNWAELAKRGRTIANTELFSVGTNKITLATILIVVGIVVLTAVASRMVQAGIRRALARRGIDAEGTLATTNRLTHYAIMVVGLAIAMQTAGIKLDALFAAGAVFAVGFAFAMQNIAQNFVSGLILLLERTIHAHDIVELDKEPVRILQMGIRSTLVETLDGESMIVPNSLLVQSTVKNYTLRDRLVRVRVSVGVSYASDMKQVRQLLEGVGERHTKERPALITLEDFGSSSVVWDIAIWMDDAWRFRAKQSQLREEIWELFKERGVEIAFPQVDVHFDPPVADGLARLGRAA